MLTFLFLFYGVAQGVIIQIEFFFGDYGNPLTSYAQSVII